MSMKNLLLCAFLAMVLVLILNASHTATSFSASRWDEHVTRHAENPMGDTRGVEQEGMSAGGQEPRDPRCEDVAAGKEGTLNDDDDAAADPNVEGDRRDLEDLKRKYSFLKRFSEGVCYRDGGILPRNPKDFGVWGEADGNPLKLRPINTNFFDAMESILHDGDAYQFGVLDGESLGWLQGIMEDNFFWGFDSFEGLPDEDEKVPNLNAWSQGKFRNTMSLEELSNIYGGPERVKLIRGFYNESLQTTARDLSQLVGREMKPAVYVDIDCDLYISTVQALDWMFRNKIIRKGTIIGYDDWWVMPCASLQSTRGDFSSYEDFKENSSAVDVYQHGGEALVLQYDKAAHLLTHLGRGV